MSKLKFNILKTKNKKEFIDCTHFFNLPNHPTFHSEERLVNFAEEEESFFVGLSTYIISWVQHSCPIILELA